MVDTSLLNLPVDKMVKWGNLLRAAITLINNDLEATKKKVDAFGQGGGSGGVPPSVILNVRNFGAVGDGVTDDTLAITNCMRAAMVASGAAVYFPPGTYLVDGIGIDYSGSEWEVQPDSGPPYGYAAPRVFGAGMTHSKIKQKSGSTKDVFTIQGKLGDEAGPGNNNKATGAIVEHLEIEGTSTGGNGFYMRALVNCSVRNVRISDVGKSGIYCAREKFVSGVDDEYSYANSIEEVKIVRAAWWGIQHSGAASIGGVYRSVEAIGCKLGGFKVAPTNLKVDVCQAIGCGVGLVDGRGFLAIPNTNTTSVNSTLVLDTFRSEGNGAPGGYEVEIRSGIGYAIYTPSFYATLGAHALGIGLMGYGSTGFVQAMQVIGGFYGTATNTFPDQKAIVLGSDARDTLISNPRFQYQGSKNTPEQLITDNGFRTSVMLNANVRMLPDGPLSLTRLIAAGVTVPNRAGEAQIYMQTDSATGKPAVYIKFGSGAAVQIAIQP
jgi:hypothetical protein